MRLDGITIDQLSSTRNDLDRAAVVAARAFYDDPFFVFLEPRPMLRARALALFWKSAVRALGPAGNVLVARRPDGETAGVAAWVRPGMYPLPVSRQLRDLLGALRAMGPRPKALLDGLKYLLAIEKAHPKEEMWYLLLLVTDPSMQRGGIGTALQEGILGEADAAGLPCYLETQKQDNIAYYGRFGYEVVDELHPVKGGPPLWAMRRPAK